MSETDQRVSEQLGELVRSVERLQSELQPDRRPLRPPSPRDLARFTSEVTIPALVLVLETNVRALKLLQRTLQLADQRAVEGGRSRPPAEDRVAALGRTTLSRLDAALSDLGDALEGRPPEDRPEELFDRVRELQADVEAELAADPPGDSASEPVDIDVEAELQSLKDDLDDGADGE